MALPLRAGLLLAACCLARRVAGSQAQAPTEATPSDSPQGALEAQVLPGFPKDRAQAPEPKAQTSPATEVQTLVLPEAAAGDEEPHLFELLGGRGRGRGRGAGGRRIDYYYHYPRDMSASRTKRQSAQLLQQAMYRARGRLRDLARAVAPHARRMAYRMAILDGRLRALAADLRAVWSMAANNELAVAFSLARLLGLYAHALRKFLDLTYVVEFLLLEHRGNLKAVYRLAADVEQANRLAANRSQQTPPF